jgi:hypothetical protein
MKKLLLPLAYSLIFSFLIVGRLVASDAVDARAILRIDEGYVENQGAFIYYESFGSGPPLLILHGGPGASHDYFLPYLVPLARANRLVFIDERGSGKSAKMDNPADYTIDNMVSDAEAVRQALGLGKINLLGIPAAAFWPKPTRSSTRTTCPISCFAAPFTARSE